MAGTAAGQKSHRRIQARNNTAKELSPRVGQTASRHSIGNSVARKKTTAPAEAEAIGKSRQR
jgi:hypothetical protein